MDDLLGKFSQAKRGILVDEFHVGSTGHAHDLRSVTSNIADLHYQASTVISFKKQNF